MVQMSTSTVVGFSASAPTLGLSGTVAAGVDDDLIVDECARSTYTLCTLPSPSPRAPRTPLPLIAASATAAAAAANAAAAPCLRTLPPSLADSSVDDLSPCTAAAMRSFPVEGHREQEAALAARIAELSQDFLADSGVGLVRGRPPLVHHIRIAPPRKPRPPH